jgi:hypothetical protein
MEMAMEGAHGAATEAIAANAHVHGGDAKSTVGPGAEAGAETIAETKSRVVSIDVPHDQQPA